MSDKLDATSMVEIIINNVCENSNLRHENNIKLSLIHTLQMASVAHLVHQIIGQIFLQHTNAWAYLLANLLTALHAT